VTLGIANGGVTFTQLSATGSATGQVLTVKRSRSSMASRCRQSAGPTGPTGPTGSTAGTSDSIPNTVVAA